MRTLQVGVAIGEDIFAASWRSSEWTIVLRAGPAADAIHDAAAEVNRLIGPKHRVRAWVAILPPLVGMKRVDLPKMSDEDCRLALATNSESHFLGRGQSPVCGTVRIPRRDHGRMVSVLGFAARARLIEGITSGLEAAGWTVRRIVPAQAAWASGVLLRHSDARRRALSIGVRLARETNIIEMASGSITCVRRFRNADELRPLEPNRPWFIVGTGSADASAAIAAAKAAKLPRRFEMLSDASRRARAARSRRITRRFIGLACFNLLAAAVAYRLRLERELARVETDRVAIRLPASRGLAIQDSTRRLAERVSVLAGLEQSAPRWSAVLSRIVVGLPADARLSSIRGEADSVIVEGLSIDASRVMSALQRAPGVRATRALAPFVHEASDESDGERWRIGLRVDHREATRR